ncbi:MAG: hypothetical protein KJN76_10560 [Eudoraea sp.]|nr:hypothetical protein [Eudoraea sp.]
MKAIAQIKHLNCDEEKRIVIRNLSRIMDIKIFDIDIENGRIYFGYTTPIALYKVKQELSRIGHPVETCNHLSPNQAATSDNNANTSVFI